MKHLFNSIIALCLLASTAFAYQASIVIPNGTGAQVRTNLNNALQAITTNQGAAGAPSTTYPYQLWADTSTGFMKARNAANNGWIVLWSLSTSFSSQNYPNAAVIRDQNGSFNAAVIGGEIIAGVRNNTLSNALGDVAQVQANAGQGFVPAIALTEGNVLAHILYKAVGSTDGTLRFRTNTGIDGKYWTDYNDGAGTGLDADLLDGQHGSYYINSTSIGSATAGAATNATGTGSAVKSADSGLRMLKGSIAGSGTIIQGGSGWSMGTVNTGIYTVVFSPAFSTPPTVVATLTQNAGNAVTSIFNNSVSTTQAVFNIVSAGALVNRDFAFIAIGGN